MRVIWITPKKTRYLLSAIFTFGCQMYSVFCSIRHLCRFLLCHCHTTTHSIDWQLSFFSLSWPQCSHMLFAAIRSVNEKSLRPQNGCVVGVLVECCSNQFSQLLQTNFNTTSVIKSNLGLELQYLYEINALVNSRVSCWK